MRMINCTVDNNTLYNTGFNKVDHVLRKQIN